jgi:peroxiredoxin
MTIDTQPVDRPNVPRVGETAPDFRLPNTSGEERRLSDMVKERPTILVFYRGHW